ncbi:probable Ufm1-specific protease 1 [Chironomus tepperi]|uniref:probable Ufm1-specific protease 1 n=1 Tax=Chironomus tepperi TaxID=113505 RepID=UPI00391F4FD5
MSVPKYQLFENIHKHLELPTESGETYLTRENYDYYHYCCDGINDVGYGCGYRTVQSICSMLKKKLNSEKSVPSLLDIQKVLVKFGDKDERILNSRSWIGTLEGSYVIDELFNVPCYIVHISHDEKISSKRSDIMKYFKEQGGLIFMGGDSDASAKMITGIHIAQDDKLFLQVVDPHFSQIPKNPHEIVNKGYVKWYAENDFIENSFYNLCMPKLN